MVFFLHIYDNHRRLITLSPTMFVITNVSLHLTGQHGFKVITMTQDVKFRTSQKKKRGGGASIYIFVKSYSTFIWYI